MDERGYESVAEFRGSMSQGSVPDPTVFERANYMRTLISYSGEV
jgi:dihydroorotate dehydrogenase (fumarate)